MTETTTELEAFVLDDGTTGQPAILPAAVTDTGPPVTLAITYPNERTVEVPSSDALPGTDIASLDEMPTPDESMWVASLTADAPAGLWAEFWTHHCRDLDLILGLWIPRPKARALHVRGRTPSGAPAVLSVPLLDPTRRARATELIETDQHTLLDEATNW